MLKKFTFTLCFMLLFAGNSYAVKEDLGFLIFDVPLGWSIADRKDNEFTLVNEDRTAAFIYKIAPYYKVKLLQYAEAVMRAHSGFQLRQEKTGVYTFDFISNGNTSFTTVQFCKDGFACIQTGIGKDQDLDSLFDIGVLK